MILRALRIAVLALFALCGLYAGPIGFGDLDVSLSPPPVLNCGACAYIVTFEDLEVPADLSDVYPIIGFMAALIIIGMLGVRFRVRQRHYVGADADPVVQEGRRRKRIAR